MSHEELYGKLKIIILVFFGSLQLSYFRFEAKRRENNIHIFKMIHTPIDTPVQAYIYRLIQLYINTQFSFQDTFCFCILCRLYTDTYIQADTYTLHT